MTLSKHKNVKRPELKGLSRADYHTVWTRLRRNELRSQAKDVPGMIFGIWVRTNLMERRQP